MNAESIIQAAEKDGLRLALTDVGTVKCIGPKQMTERWAPQLRQHKAAIVAALTAANDDDPSMDDADEFWRTFLARVTECDKLINSLCDLRGDDDEHRAALLAVRKRMPPQKLDGDIAYLRNEIKQILKENP